MYSLIDIHLLTKFYAFDFEACKARNIIQITADDVNK